MNVRIIGLFAALLLASFGAQSAPPQFVTIDNSSGPLMDNATAKAMWKETLPTARLAKLYSPRKWGFASEVEGGFNAGKTCIVTARAMLLPMRGKGLLLAPEKMATAFDAIPNATNEQCKALAKAKLKEAIQAVVAGLVAT